MAFWFRKAESRTPRVLRKDVFVRLKSRRLGDRRCGNKKCCCWKNPLDWAAPRRGQAGYLPGGCRGKRTDSNCNWGYQCVSGCCRTSGQRQISVARWERNPKGQITRSCFQRNALFFRRVRFDRSWFPLCNWRRYFYHWGRLSSWSGYLFCNRVKWYQCRIRNHS